MKINPYLMFSGECEEAMNFYAQCFGGKVNALMTYEGSPAAEHTPAEWQKKIMHACVSVGEELIMGADASPERYSKPQGGWVSLGIEEVEEAERIYKELAAGGEVMMPLEETFWAARFGMVVDRFGTPWMINCEKQG